MAPRVQPKVFILLLKTHKLTVLTTVSSTATVNDLKGEALEALQSSVLQAPSSHAEFAMDEDSDPSEWVVPKVSSMDEFELARAVKDKGRPTGLYEKLDRTAQLKNVVTNWDSVFIQFRDPNGGLFPVKVSIPPIFAEEEEDPASSAARKGKRKAVE
ncbi:hypothetical protein C8Q80DRAFT_1155534 [Daedaleopsis nitida]|nr:hypothetical protein C8Q80DRAFT_1155534 [Daedaleopsis nitida]